MSCILQISFHSTFFSFNLLSPFKKSITSFNVSAPYIFIPFIIDASFKFLDGIINVFKFSFFASMHFAKTPLTPFILPSKESSPINPMSSRFIFFIFFILESMPTAIGKSKKDPSFFMLAGAKFTTTFLLKTSYPEFFIAVFTLSFDSLTLVPGSPTTSHAGIPADTSTCTSIM